MDSLDMETFLDWRRMYHHAPWGEVRGDLRMSIMGALHANIHRNTKKRSKAYEPEEFLAMTPSGRRARDGRRSRSTSLPQEYQPTTPTQFARQSSALRAAFGAQPLPTPQLITAEEPVRAAAQEPARATAEETAA